VRKACRSEYQTISKVGVHAKWAALICARPSGATVEMAHSVEARSGNPASVFNLVDAY
jgi:hypothetical protein